MIALANEKRKQEEFCIVCSDKQSQLGVYTSLCDTDILSYL